MKQSKLSNLIQFSLNASGGTLTSPTRIMLYPCNDFITMVIAMYDTSKLVFKIEQDGKQLFPVRSNLASGYFKPGLQATNGFCRINDLHIPVNPNSPLTVAYCNDDGTQPASFIALVMSSDDNEDALAEAVNKLIGKLTTKEVIK